MHREFVVFRKSDFKSLDFLVFVDVVIMSILNSSTVIPFTLMVDRRLQIGASDPLGGFHGQNYSIHKLSFHP